jgi:hypothetical protein
MSRPPRHISDRELAFRIYGIAALSISAFLLAMSVLAPELLQGLRNILSLLFP